MNLTLDHFAGCMLGLATGDALGAPHLGGLLERLVWRFIGRTSDGCLRWTDDTQMALDVAESLLTEDGIRPEAPRETIRVQLSLEPQIRPWGGKSSQAHPTWRVVGVSDQGGLRRGILRQWCRHARARSGSVLPA